MFTRIVKMEFKEAEIDSFLANFEKVKEKIRSFTGCEHLRLLRDKNDANIFFTYSKWQTEDDLEEYRNSELFKGVWATTKPKFRCKAQAWSVGVVEEIAGS
ncbi:putative quinol monooxygenase [Marinirhabdus gelatinilytica]|uniref:Quinol monooxygenase YgiN n=1 Tax=Marinirhabdus gelatinilytica TaxID=1703343 RepID=A0A370QG97_9FLAO|nr:antibiotic biosynthesis monooxygenase family protein [Marinirhabdus gelatinilytica]RDK87394.1 quinol monooxygenase YgiN [Marinirhabdus gelatinilytica]